MKRLGKFLVANSKKSLFGFIAVILLSSFWGFQSFGFLKAGGYDDPGSDSASVANILTKNVSIEIHSKHMKDYIWNKENLACLCFPA